MRNSDFNKIEKEWKKEIRESHDIFVKEYVQENTDWVKERRLEFLENEWQRTLSDMLLSKKILDKSDEKDWFFDFIEEVFLKLEIKKGRRVLNEIEMYKNEKLISAYENSLSPEEIEDAHNADCSEFVEIKKKSGNNSFSLCPFHNEKTPSFCCFKNGRYKCFGCGEAGDAIDLVMKLHNSSFFEAVKMINKI